MKANTPKRAARNKQTAEVFTPPWLVNQMLDKLPPEMWEPERTFIDSSCGNGNMLLEVLKRKLDKGHDPLQALKTIFGVDIMDDNIRECRWRLLKLVHERGHQITREMLVEVFCNLVVTRLGKKYPNGALDYHFGFYRTISKDNHKVGGIDAWMDKIENHGWLDGEYEDDCAEERDALKDDPDEPKLFEVEPE